MRVTFAGSQVVGAQAEAPPLAPADRAGLQRLLAAVPKTELHTHLMGSTPLGALRRMLEAEGWQAADIDRQLAIKPRYQDLRDFLSAYGRLAKPVKTPEHFRQAAFALAQDAAIDGVRYLEVRTSLSGKQGEPEAMIAAVEAGLKAAAGWARQTLGIDLIPRVIVLAKRNHDAQKTLAEAKLAVALAKRPGSLIVGFDLAADETGFAVTRHRETLRYVKQNGLKLTVHAGETPSSEGLSGPESMRAALKLGADRIGHGIQAVNSPRLMKKLAKNQTPLEVCPISNENISTVSSLSAHPLPAMLRQGLNVNLNTDNRTLSSVTLTDQLWRLYETGLLQCWELIKRTSLNGVSAAFLPDAQKRSLARQFEQTFDSLETAYGPLIKRFLCLGCDHQPRAWARSA